MKEMLLTFSLFGLAAGTAAAQTNVTVYGIVDAGIGIENNGAGRVTSLNSGGMNGSRVGFTGREDLGGGLAAIFRLENGFSTDTGAAAQGGLLFGRAAWVGLTGNMGTVLVGRQSTPVHASINTFDPFVDSMAGDSGRLFNYSGTRIDNVVTYTYNAKNGLRGQLLYSFGEVAGNSAAKRTFGGYTGYKNGGFDSVLVYTDGADATGALRTKTTLLGINYDFRVIKLYATHAWNRDIGMAGVRTRDALIGFTAPLGSSNRIIGSYIRKTNETVSNAGASQIGVGFVHDLSKRTSLYSSYSKLRNDSHASYRVVVAGATDNFFNMGIRHRF